MIYDIKHLLPLTQIMPTKTMKAGVVVHFTAGSHDPVATIEGWNSDPARIAAHAVIGGISRKGDTQYDGKIVQAIDSDLWAYHLGIPAKYDVLSKPQGYYDQRFLGIEVCNYGPLTLVNGKFMTYVNSEIPAAMVTDLGAGNEYRGFRYYHSITDAQCQALCRLIAYYSRVCGFELEANRAFTPLDFRYDIGFGHSKTVTFHSNFRADKTDWYGAPKLIAALNELHAHPEKFA